MPKSSKISIWHPSSPRNMRRERRKCLEVKIRISVASHKALLPKLQLKHNLHPASIKTLNVLSA